jgi:hypothetical protein
MARSTFHVLELLRDAEAYPLDVRHVFERLGAGGRQAGDLSNSLRFFATSLFCMLQAPSEQVVRDVGDVYRWIQNGATTRREVSQQAKERFEEKEADLLNLGYCAEEIFGDSPLGESMHTRRRFMQQQQRISDLWVEYETVATQYREACNELVSPTQWHDGFVDVQNLSLCQTEPFPYGVFRMAKDVADELCLSFSNSDGASLTIYPQPKEGAVTATGENSVQIIGGLLKSVCNVLIERLPVDSFNLFSIRFRGEELRRTTMVVHKTPKTTSIVGVLNNCPIVRVVRKADRIEYGFCSTGSLKDMSQWVPRSLVKQLQ